MADQPRTSTYLKRLSLGLILALGVGTGVVTVSNTIWALSRSLPILALWGGDTVFQILIASAALILLALLGAAQQLGKRARRTWIVGICLTVAFWAFYTYGITRPYEGGGADIGLYLLMMISPLLIVAASLLVSVTSADERSANEARNDG